MTNYQTTIQKPGAIRWGSAKIELKAESGDYINLGAIRSISAKLETTGYQDYEPDNAPPIKMDPIPKAWIWTFTLEEAWNPDIIKLMRGDIDTYSEETGKQVIGVYAGTGTRPALTMRITNTTAGAEPAVIELTSCRITSELDWAFPADADRQTPISLPVTMSAEWMSGTGFGTITLPEV